MADAAVATQTASTSAPVAATVVASAPPASGAAAAPAASPAPAAATVPSAPAAQPAPAVPAVTPPAEIKYEIKAPDGVTLGKAESDEYTAFAKARGLSNDQLNALVERDVKSQKAHHEKLVGQMDQQDKDWLGVLQGHKEYGGEKFNETVLTVKGVYDRFDQSGTFRKLLESSKLAHHPQLFEFVLAIGKTMKPDTLVSVPAAPYAQGKVDPMKTLEASYGKSPGAKK